MSALAVKTQVHSPLRRVREEAIDLSDQKATAIFRRAQQEYNRGLKYTSLQTAKYALKVGERNGEYCKAYICGYLAQLKLELGQPERALFYALQAINSLDPLDHEYGEDKAYYRLLVQYMEQQCSEPVTCNLVNRVVVRS